MLDNSVVTLCNGRKLWMWVMFCPVSWSPWGSKSKSKQNVRDTPRKQRKRGRIGLLWKLPVNVSSCREWRSLICTDGGDTTPLSDLVQYIDEQWSRGKTKPHSEMNYFSALVWWFEWWYKQAIDMSNSTLTVTLQKAIPVDYLTQWNFCAETNEGCKAGPVDISRCHVARKPYKKRETSGFHHCMFPMPSIARWELVHSEGGAKIV